MFYNPKEVLKRATIRYTRLPFNKKSINFISVWGIHALSIKYSRHKLGVFMTLTKGLPALVSSRRVRWVSRSLFSCCLWFTVLPFLGRNGIDLYRKICIFTVNCFKFIFPSGLLAVNKRYNHRRCNNYFWLHAESIVNWSVDF